MMVTYLESQRKIRLSSHLMAFRKQQSFKKFIKIFFFCLLKFAFSLVGTGKTKLKIVNFLL